MSEAPFAFFAVTGQVSVDFGSLVLVQHAESVEFEHVLQLLATHATAASVSSDRRTCSAERVHVFTVPKGCWRRSAISVWDIPS